MIYIILSISFVIHAFLFLAVVFLKKQLEGLQQSTIEDTDKLLEKHLEEIRLENDRFQALLAETHKKNKSDESSPSHLASKVSNMSSYIEKQTLENSGGLDFKKLHDQVETSFQAKVLQLYQKGLSVTEIAQELNCGKAEVELIIQLQTDH